MPIYEYACEACGHRFEELQDMNAAAPVCPKCKGKVKKQMSAATPLSSKHGGGKHSCCGGEARSKGFPCAGGGGCGMGNCHL